MERLRGYRGHTTRSRTDHQANRHYQPTRGHRTAYRFHAESDGETMNKQRKAQVAWWAAKVYEQALEYADVIDPKRQRVIRVANKLDAIARLTTEIHFE